MIDCLSSDISIGFYIDSCEKDSIDHFVDRIYELNSSYSDPLLSVLNDRVEASDFGDDIFSPKTGTFGGKFVDYEEPYDEFELRES